MVSEMPWISSRRQVSGTTILKGQRIGRHGVCSESLADRNEYSPSSPTHEEQHDKRREEEDDVGRRVDHATGADRPVFEEEIGANVCALVQRIGGAEHEDRAVQHVREIVGPDGRSSKEIAGDHFVADRQDQRNVQPRDAEAEAVGEPIDPASNREKSGEEIARIPILLREVRNRGSCCPGSRLPLDRCRA